MPLYIGDYLADTQHLTAAQHGAYLLLIMHYWQHGKLPDSEAAIAGISRLNRDQWRSNCSAIAGMFQPGWKHKRIEEELKKANDISTKRAVAGFKGAERTNRKFTGAYPAIARQMHTQSQSPIESSLESEPRTTVAGPARKQEKTLAPSASLDEIVRAKGWVP